MQKASQRIAAMPTDEESGERKFTQAYDVQEKSCNPDATAPLWLLCVPAKSSDTCFRAFSSFVAEVTKVPPENTSKKFLFSFHFAEKEPWTMWVVFASAGSVVALRRTQASIQKSAAARNTAAAVSATCQ